MKGFQICGFHILGLHVSLEYRTDPHNGILRLGPGRWSVNLWRMSLRIEYYGAAFY